MAAELGAVAGLPKTGRTCLVQDPFMEDNESGAMEKNTGISLSGHKLYRPKHYVVWVKYVILILFLKWYLLYHLIQKNIGDEWKEVYCCKTFFFFIQTELLYSFVVQDCSALAGIGFSDWIVWSPYCKTSSLSSPNMAISKVFRTKTHNTLLLCLVHAVCPTSSSVLRK